MKEAFAQEPDNLKGYCQAIVVLEEQKFYWGDMFFVFTRPQNKRNMKFWPTNPPTFWFKKKIRMIIFFPKHYVYNEG